MSDKKLEELIQASAATSDFKAAIRTFVAGLDSELIRCSAGSPRVKVLRVLMKLLETFPGEEISDVRIEGVSSCSAFEGKLWFGPDGTEVVFNWDCHWKAKQEKMNAWYGAPDQTRAAKEFGYQCFETFERADSRDVVES